MWKGAYPTGQLVGQREAVTIPVLPGARTTNFTFAYTSTTADAAISKVTVSASVGFWLAGMGDAYPADNAAIASSTRVTR